jgi:hypothetical protein
VIDGLPPEAFNGGVAASKFRDSQLLINKMLWNCGTV